ncbi:hypothetical protein [Stutzerimonas nitrititolerans]|uniref:hypothetical protein n=1 Tax=Stutzerimonas nitrititolerans TaxID=2482751 RepID=UPI0028A2BE33|nr:hypothetical protein [Stutzerimonas nitrititolerans]
MSRKKSIEERVADAERADRERAETFRRQRECDHWRATPTEWWWSGNVREMTCPECGATNYIEDREEACND